MALPVLDGNQSATTLSSVVTGGEHIVAHSVVCLGSTAIANITNAVSGSVVSISNFPSTQTVAGTVTANLSSANLNSVTIGVRGSVTANSNLTATALVDLVEPIRAGVFQWADGELQGIISNSTPVISGTVTANTAYATSITGYAGGGGSVTALPVVIADKGIYGGNLLNYNGTNTSLNISVKGIGSASLESATNFPVSGTVTVGNSVTIGSLPAISGTVTANLAPQAKGPIIVVDSTIPADPKYMAVVGGFDPFGGEARALQLGSNGGVIVQQLPAISGTVTANGSQSWIDPNAVTVSGFLPVGGWDVVNSQFAPIPLNDLATAVQVTQDPASAFNVIASGTVTAAAPNGSLTTRFGTPTTANVSFATSAVTNANRKYLLIQNVTTGSNVITVGIGFTPTTTQGIQLTAGAGITFESSYIPTGQIFVLSSVTASNFTILEA